MAKYTSLTTLQGKGGGKFENSFYLIGGYNVSFVIEITVVPHDEDPYY